MHELNREAGVTVVIVTHDPLVASRTDRIIYLSDGRIIREERPSLHRGGKKWALQ